MRIATQRRETTTDERDEERQKQRHREREQHNEAKSSYVCLLPHERRQPKKCFFFVFGLVFGLTILLIGKNTRYFILKRFPILGCLSFDYPNNSNE
jgi:hypothetical protein